MSDTREGGCACGAVRYRVKSAPLRATVCHCRFCQRRTGSAFGIGVYFKPEDVEFLQGALKVCEHRSDETGRSIRTEFCINCGTSVTWTIEAMPDSRAIAGGTFDDPHRFKIARHSWTRSAHRWIALPPDVPAFEKSALPALFLRGSMTGSSRRLSRRSGLQAKQASMPSERQTACDWQKKRGGVTRP